MKFGAKAKGLVNVSGFHVDPGYKGRLIFAVYNAGPLNFHVQYGERLFVIWFAELDAIDDCPRKGIGFDSISPSLINSPDLVSSLPSLVKRLDEMDKRLETYTIKQAIVWVVVVALILSFVKPLTDKLAAAWLGLDNNKSELVKPSPASQAASEFKEKFLRKQVTNSTI
jgi:dCTP deaminase